MRISKHLFNALPLLLLMAALWSCQKTDINPSQALPQLDEDGLFIHETDPAADQRSTCTCSPPAYIVPHIRFASSTPGTNTSDSVAVYWIPSTTPVVGYTLSISIITEQGTVASTLPTTTLAATQNGFITPLNMVMPIGYRVRTTIRSICPSSTGTTCTSNARSAEAYKGGGGGVATIGVVYNTPSEVRNKICQQADFGCDYIQFTGDTLYVGAAKCAIKNGKSTYFYNPQAICDCLTTSTVTNPCNRFNSCLATNPNFDAKDLIPCP